MCLSESMSALTMSSAVRGASVYQRITLPHSGLGLAEKCICMAASSLVCLAAFAYLYIEGISPKTLQGNQRSKNSKKAFYSSDAHMILNTIVQTPFF